MHYMSNSMNLCRNEAVTNDVNPWQHRMLDATGNQPVNTTEAGHAGVTLSAKSRRQITTIHKVATRVLLRVQASH